MNFFEKMCCPFCKTSLEISPFPKEGFGVFHCSCGKYPIVDGIPILKRGGWTQRILQFIEERKYPLALAIAISPSIKNSLWRRYGRKILRRMFPSMRWDLCHIQKTQRMLDRDPFPTFEDFLKFFYVESANPFSLAYDYLYFRRTSPTFLSILALLKIKDFTKGPILDLCCGSGHVTRNLTYLNEGDVVGLDGEFFLVWLAKKFLAPRAFYVCADVNFSLPFTPEAFQTVLCADALFDVENASALAMETLRVSQANGRVFFARLLNRAIQHIYSGRHPLLPEEYRALFLGSFTQLIPERLLLEHYLQGKRFNFEASFSAEDLKKESSVALIVSKEPRSMEEHDREVEKIPGEWQINPRYFFSESSHEFRKKSPADSRYLDEYAQESLYLTDPFHVDALINFETLVNKRLLVSLPERYAHEGVDITKILHGKGCDESTL